MVEQEFRQEYCIIGQAEARQKILTVRFLKSSRKPIIAIDFFNAEKKELVKTGKYAVVFRPSLKIKPTAVIEKLEAQGWPAERIIVEGEDFPVGELPDSMNMKGK